MCHRYVLQRPGERDVRDLYKDVTDRRTADRMGISPHSFSNTSRYKASAVPSLQRLLNRDNKEKRLILKGLFNGIKSNQETKKKKVDIKDPNLRVNYVCNVDVIT